MGDIGETWRAHRAERHANWTKNAEKFTAERRAQLEAAAKVSPIGFRLRDDDTVARVWLVADPAHVVDWWLRSGSARIVGSKEKSIYARDVTDLLLFLRSTK